MDQAQCLQSHCPHHTIYASETWTVYQRHAKKLNRFHLNCLRKLLRVKWQDKVPDTEILEQTGMSSIFTMLRKTQLRWAGHVVRMPDERLPKRILYGELLTGARSHGGQKKRFKDTLKASLKDFGIDHNLWETTAQNRAAWRGVINKGAAAYDSRRLETAKSKRATRKSRASSAPETHDPTVLPCPLCPRTFKAKIGLISHLRTHPTPPDMMKMVFFPQEGRTHGRDRYYKSLTRKHTRTYMSA